MELWDMLILLIHYLDKGVQPHLIIIEFGSFIQSGRMHLQTFIMQIKDTSGNNGRVPSKKPSSPTEPHLISGEGLLEFNAAVYSDISDNAMIPTLWQ